MKISYEISKGIFHLCVPAITTSSINKVSLVLSSIFTLSKELSRPSSSSGFNAKDAADIMSSSVMLYAHFSLNVFLSVLQNASSCSQVSMSDIILTCAAWKFTSTLATVFISPLGVRLIPFVQTNALSIMVSAIMKKIIYLYLQRELLHSIGLVIRELMLVLYFFIFKFIPMVYLKFSIEKLIVYDMGNARCLKSLL